MNLLSPNDVLTQLAHAMPEACRSQVIIIGSLAAGWHFADTLSDRGVRTKDIDCMFSPHAKAVAAAHDVTEQLLDADWRLRPGRWGTPGTPETPTDQLPLVRLLPRRPTNRGIGSSSYSAHPTCPGPTFQPKRTIVCRRGWGTSAFVASVSWHLLNGGLCVPTTG